MGVDIHQTRDHIRAVQIGPAASVAVEDLGKAAIFDHKAAVDKARGGKHIRIGKQHLTPPAGLPRQCSARRGGLSRPAA